MKGILEFKTTKNGRVIKTARYENMETNLRRDACGMANGISVAKALKDLVGGIVLTPDTIPDSVAHYGAPVNVMAFGNKGADAGFNDTTKRWINAGGVVENADNVVYTFKLGDECGVGAIKAIGLVPMSLNTSLFNSGSVSVALNNIRHDFISLLSNSSILKLNTRSTTDNKVYTGERAVTSDDVDATGYSFGETGVEPCTYDGYYFIIK